MKRLLQFFIYAPLGILLIAVSVANRDPITLSLDPFSRTDPAIAFQVPLFWLIFGSLATGMLLGGFITWLKQGRFRREARDQRYEAAKARHEAKKATAEGAPFLANTGTSLPAIAKKDERFFS